MMRLPNPDREIPAPRCTRHYEHRALTTQGRTWVCNAPGHPPYSVAVTVVNDARLRPRQGEAARETLRALGVAW